MHRSPLTLPAAIPSAFSILIAVVLAQIASMAGGAFGARADVIAHFTATSIQGGCYVDDQEPFGQGDPERRLRMVIFDDDASARAGCGPGCVADADPATPDGQHLDYCTIDTGCGTWNFPDRSVSKVVADRSPAHFYFGLFDEDTSDQSDSLGDHWIVASGPMSGSVFNNNASPYKPGSATPVVAQCGDLVEGTGDAGNFQLNYSIHFEDTTGPNVATNIQPTDDGLFTYLDNDATISFVWTPANDPNSGISETIVELVEGALPNVILTQSIGETTSVSICDGCALSAQINHDTVYWLRLKSTNGEYPTIENPQWAVSDWFHVQVDLVNPTSTITAPAAGAWIGVDDPTLSIAESDSGAGLGTCFVEVKSNGATTVASETRPCAADYTLSTGPTSACRHEGPNTCEVRIWSEDYARRTSSIHSRTYGVDFGSDVIHDLEVFTHQGGTPIYQGVAQPDPTPYITWSAPVSTSSIVGYSWNWYTGDQPDCIADLTETSFEPPALSPGYSAFRVRAIDAAGNCGPVETFYILVGGTPAVPLLGPLAVGVLCTGLAAVVVRKTTAAPKVLRL